MNRMNDFETLIEQESPIGAIEISATTEGLLRIHLLGNLVTRGQKPDSLLDSSIAYQHARLAMDQILEFMARKRERFDLPLDLRFATPFQKRVYQTALEIPFGGILTYGELAKKMSTANASRAVGAALGKNPLLIVIPCHRVVASDGRLTGFSAAGGIKTKQWLLEMEGHKIVGQKLV